MLTVSAASLQSLLRTFTKFSLLPELELHGKKLSQSWEEIGSDENTEPFLGLILGSPFTGTEVWNFKNESLIRRVLLTQKYHLSSLSKTSISATGLCSDG